MRAQSEAAMHPPPQAAAWAPDLSSTAMQKSHSYIAAVVEALAEHLGISPQTVAQGLGCACRYLLHIPVLEGLCWRCCSRKAC